LCSGSAACFGCIRRARRQDQDGLDLFNDYNDLALANRSLASIDAKRISNASGKPDKMSEKAYAKQIRLKN
jgi:hypothetical protein